MTLTCSVSSLGDHWLRRASLSRSATLFSSMIMLSLTSNSILRVGTPCKHESDKQNKTITTQTPPGDARPSSPAYAVSLNFGIRLGSDLRLLVSAYAQEKWLLTPTLCFLHWQVDGNLFLQPRTSTPDAQPSLQRRIALRLTSLIRHLHPQDHLSPSYGAFKTRLLGLMEFHTQLTPSPLRSPQ